VTFKGDVNATELEAAPATSTAAASSNVLPPEGVHPDAGTNAAGLPVPPGATKEQVALGDRIFHGEIAEATCGGCHGSDAKGTPVGADLTSGKWLCGDGSLASLEKVIETGVAEPKEHSGAMPPMGGVELTQEQLAAVSALCLVGGPSEWRLNGGTITIRIKAAASRSPASCGGVAQRVRPAVCW
jgi:mono/diheme cytochrome c family protein